MAFQPLLGIDTLAPGGAPAAPAAAPLVNVHVSAPVPRGPDPPRSLGSPAPGLAPVTAARTYRSAPVPVTRPGRKPNPRPEQAANAPHAGSILERVPLDAHIAAARHRARPAAPTPAPGPNPGDLPNSTLIAGAPPAGPSAAPRLWWLERPRAQGAAADPGAAEPSAAHAPAGGRWWTPVGPIATPANPRPAEPLATPAPTSSQWWTPVGPPAPPASASAAAGHTAPPLARATPLTVGPETLPISLPQAPRLAPARAAPQVSAAIVRPPGIVRRNPGPKRLPGAPAPAVGLAHQNLGGSAAAALAPAHSAEAAAAATLLAALPTGNDAPAQGALPQSLSKVRLQSCDSSTGTYVFTHPVWHCTSPQ